MKQYKGYRSNIEVVHCISGGYAIGERPWEENLQGPGHSVAGGL